MSQNIKTIKYETIVSQVSTLCIDSCYKLPDDVIESIKAAAESESNPAATELLNQLILNAEIAVDQKIPICQDTGLAVVFVEQGSEVIVEAPQDKTLIDAINDGVAIGYETGLLRKSVVSEPLNTRTNTGTNTPSIIHHTIVPGQSLKISVMSKGGGCENKSQFKMFNPTDDKQIVIDWIVKVVTDAGANACPPFVIGVGIGGNFELSCLLSKRALLRNMGVKSEDDFYAKMEETLLDKINQSGLGPQGLGGDTTALAVNIETAPCHIASLPVAVNIECHAHRHKSITL